MIIDNVKSLEENWRSVTLITEEPSVIFLIPYWFHYNEINLIAHVLHINNALVLSFNYLKICLEFEVFQLFEDFIKYNMFFQVFFS